MNTTATDSARTLTLLLSATVLFGAALLETGGIEHGWLFVSIAAALVWLACIPAADHGKLIPRDGFALLMALELVWLLVLPFLSPLPEVSLSYSLALLALPLVFFLSRATAANSALIRNIERVASAIAVAVMVLGLLEFLILRSRPSSLFLDSNLLAALANAFLFAAYGRCLGRWRSDGLRAALRSGPAAIVVVAVLTLIATTSLGGLLCFTAALSLMTLIVGRRQRQAWQGLLLLLILAGLMYQLVYSYQTHRPSPFARIAVEAREGGHATANQAGFLTERRELALSALAIYRDQPWYGSGTGTFKALYPAYRSKLDRSTGGNLVHNDYVQFLMEGGPLLLLPLLGILGALLMALAGAWRQFGSRNIPASDADYQKLGFATGALALAMHAVPNFVFYAISLSALMGYFLAQIRPAPISAPTFTATRATPAWLVPAGSALAGLILVFFIGLPSAFLHVRSGDCTLRACDQLRRANSSLPQFAKILTAVQPSWLPGREYLIDSYRQKAEAAPSRQERRRYAGEAIFESSTLLARYPLAYPQYLTLAGLLETYPEQADWLAEGVPASPEALYRKALSYDPTLAVARVKLATILRERSATREAYSLLIDGLEWRDVAMVGNRSRLAMLDIALPIAVRLGECREAREMADGLLAYDKEHRRAADIQSGLPVELDAIINVAGCGLAAEIAS